MMRRSAAVSVTSALRFLIVLWLVLLSASIVQDIAGWASGSDFKVWRFDVDFEGSLYTWYSGTLLILVALAALVLATREFAARSPWRYHWLGIALLFALLSMDETLSLHEQLSAALSAREKVDGWLHFRWVVPVGLATLAFAVAYLRFLAHLPGRIAALMVAAGATFVLGAIGMELIAGKLVSESAASLHGIGYRLLVNIEEALEVAGAILFLYTLVRYGRQTGLDRVDMDLHASGVGLARSRFTGTPAE
ncbi:hypothetical protein [Cereibacter sphaeroides]|uniref:hypothetical protein n=2 Tax=Cereibacter sphaeroides TaxID=1063 RepID=UPI001F3E8117|nr:hypothetical protein [Cereibacter sphaeroides]